MNRWLGLGVLAVSLACFGCGKKPAPSPASSGAGPASVGTPPAISIAVMPKGTTHIFWKTVQAGANKAATELGVKMDWVAPEKEDDRALQIQLLETQVLNRKSGIVLAPLDASALSRPVRDAARQGVPVVIFDSGIKNADDAIVSFVATDNREGGRIGARNLARLLGGKGRVVLLRYLEGSDSTTQREEGFMEAIHAFTNIQVISSEQYAGATAASAQQAGENLIMRFKQGDGVTFDGLFCVNDSSTYGMMQALKRNRLSGKVQFVGFDADPPLVDGIRSGDVQGLVVQNPYKMGYVGVYTLVTHLKGGKVDKRIDTGVAFVTPENLEQPDIQALVNPHF